MGDKRIFMATVGIKFTDAEKLSKIEGLQQFDIKNLTIYENPIELPSQQTKQVGVGEQCDDDRVSAVQI